MTGSSQVQDGPEPTRRRAADRDIPEEMVEEAAAAYAESWGHDYARMAPEIKSDWRSLPTTILTAALAGRTPIELPEPNGERDDGCKVWNIDDPVDEVHAFLEDDSPYVSFMYTDAPPDVAERLGLSLVAAAIEARRMADELRASGSGVGDQP